MESSMEDFREASDRFAMDIYTAVTCDKETSNKSIFLSPMSIQSALLLTYLGADGTTKSEIESTLRLDSRSFKGKEKEVLDVYGEVLRVFVPSKDEWGNINYELALANKAYLRKGLPVKSEFKNAIKEKLNSEVGEADFENNLPSAVSEINSWVEKQTHNKIKDLVSTQSVTKDTAFVLVNAVYFKADWETKFDPDETIKADFKNMDNRTSKVDLMHKKISAKYFVSTELELEFQLLMLPYRNRELSMIIVLPSERNGLKELEENLGHRELNKACAKAEEMKVDVYLPKFKLEQSFDLVPALQQQLSLRELFNKADLRRMTDETVAVSKIIHKTFIEVDEAGTEAAAATAVIVGFLCAMTGPPEPPPVFKADHPFFYAIRHEPTGLNVFMGRVGEL